MCIHGWFSKIRSQIYNNTKRQVNIAQTVRRWTINLMCLERRHKLTQFMLMLFFLNEDSLHWKFLSLNVSIFMAYNHILTFSSKSTAYKYLQLAINLITLLQQSHDKAMHSPTWSDSPMQGTYWLEITSACSELKQKVSGGSGHTMRIQCSKLNRVLKWVNTEVINQFWNGSA